ncbi:MAG: UDP-glucose/GDP-mannose dehydrogenase family protein, partial [Chloroflexi bacterium]|nr:UDP-glucose/GDP-mannose dehydrogenase family protein [Chloroflexota bacterium]
LRSADIAFVCVGTPAGSEGEPDMRQVQSATASLARNTPAGARLVVVNKSTMPVGTGQWMQATLSAFAPQTGAHFTVVSNPEFLREGSAVSDFLNPDRIVIGGDDSAAVEQVAHLYTPLSPAPPIVRTDTRTAEMIKYASNAFLATKISFINEMATICERIGADVQDVAQGMGLDNRIGPRFLSAGVGYGGSCFPKDVMALERLATGAGVEPRVLRAVMETNQHMRRAAVEALCLEAGPLDGLQVAILGLAFKADTDDIRESAAVEIARTLSDAGAQVRAYDPAAMGSAAPLLPNVELCADAYAAADGADAMLVLTEWPEFKELDYQRIHAGMRQAVMLDGRNLLDVDAMQALGFRYRGIGRGRTPAIEPETQLTPSRVLQAA